MVLGNVFINTLPALSGYITLNHAEDQCDYIKHPEFYSKDFEGWQECCPGFTWDIMDKRCKSRYSPERIK